MRAGAEQVLIQNGYLLEGTLCKKTLGASGSSLIHVIFMEAGPEAARAFLSQCQCAPPPSPSISATCSVRPPLRLSSLRISRAIPAERAVDQLRASAAAEEPRPPWRWR